MFADLAVIFVLISAATAVVWKASDQLENACHDLARHYGLSESVKGSTIMAISSSFPELATVILASTWHGDFQLGLAAIIGSAIFNILVIPGVSVFFRPDSLEANRNVIFREAQFYLISVMVVLVTLSFSVIYNPRVGDGLEGIVTPLMATLPFAFYFLYVFIQINEMRDQNPNSAAQRIRPLVEWGRLIGSIAFVTIGVEILIRMVISLGDTFETPSFFWSLIVLAAATSVPDLFVSINAAKRKTGTASLTNALGSNTFDLLVIIPIGVFVSGAVIIDYARTIPLMMFLVFATVVMLTMARLDFELTNRNGIVLLALYLGFIVWAGLEAFGVSPPIVP